MFNFDQLFGESCDVSPKYFDELAVLRSDCLPILVRQSKLGQCDTDQHKIAPDGFLDLPSGLGEIRRYNRIVRTCKPRDTVFRFSFVFGFVSLNGLLKTEYSLIPEGFFILPANSHMVVLPHFNGGGLRVPVHAKTCD